MTDPSIHGLRQERRGALHLFTLDRPAVRNALSTPLVLELTEALRGVATDPAVRGVVITGAGAAFCGGLDVEELRSMADQTPEKHQADADAFRDLLETLYLLPKPTFAAVNGHAVAAGAGLVTACDFALIEDGAKLGFTEAKIGFVAALVAVFLMRQLPEKYARDLLLTGRLVPADEAARMGLVTAAVPAGESLPRTLSLAEQVLGNAPYSLRVTKQMLADAPTMTITEGLRHAAALNAEARRSPSLREGVRAFLEKRAPDWNVGD